MTSEADAALEAQLAHRERELSLILEIDRIRDENARDPRKMLSAIVETIFEALHADAGLLALIDEPSSIVWEAKVDPDAILSTLSEDALYQVAQAAAALHTSSALEPGQALRSNGIHHLLVAPLRIDVQRLGSMLFLSKERAFGADDTALLAIAASQADSAVLQAQTWQQLETRAKEIENRNRQLDVIYRVDRIRDETNDIGQFLVQVADVLTDALEADLCMMGLAQETDGRISLRAVNDRINVLRDLDHGNIEDLLAHAMSLAAPQALPADETFAEQGVRYLVVAPLTIEETRLGALILGNRDTAFSLTDIDIVRAVASQADSAIAHLRTFQRANERAQQIETIYRVDHIRDQAKSEPEILSAVANIVTGTLGGDLCLMSLISEESHESELKAIEDRHGIFGQLDRNAIEQVIQWASNQTGVTTLDRESPLAKWQLKHLMGAPLIVAGRKLGSLVLASGRRPFGRHEQELMQAVVSQTDSAIVHARAEHHLRQRNRELETLYRVDHIRDQGYEFGAMLSAVLSELCAAIEAEMGFIMLFDSEANQLELKASTADDILASAGHYDLIESAANRALYNGKLYSADNLSDWLRSIMCIPLILRDQVIGVFGAVNRKGPGGFTTEDRRLLQAITSQVDTAIFESLDKQRIRNTFQRYVGPNVMEQMLATPERDWLKGERALLTVLFSDMRGFTSMSERVDVSTLVQMINMHLGAMTDVVLENDGTLDKFVADEVMAIFGAPVSKKDHAIRAIHTALGMHTAQQRLIEEWQTRGHSLPPIGIGINTGEMIVGNIGCAKQMDYTVLGDVVNLASRLCDAALENQILITDATYELVAENVQVTKLPQIRVKGKEDPVQVYQVDGLR
jgi:class 3 adenylate cyclase/GTP-sensing pleiotropic transcriptional regulator CodY